MKLIFENNIYNGVKSIQLLGINLKNIGRTFIGNFLTLRVNQLKYCQENSVLCLFPIKYLQIQCNSNQNLCFVKLDKLIIKDLWSLFPPLFFLFPNFQFKSIETGSCGGPECGVGAWLEWGRHKSGRATLQCWNTPERSTTENVVSRTEGKEQPSRGFSEPLGAVNHLQKTWPGTGCLRKEIFTCLKVLPLKY